MKFADAIKRVRKSKFYRLAIYFVPPIFLFEVYLYLMTFAYALALTRIVIGVAMIPSFPVGAKE